LRLALIGDTHFGLRSDSQVFEDYIFKFYDDVFFPYLEENEITTLVHLGDIVDRRKFINFRTLDRLRKGFINRLWDLRIDTHVILGNHDLYGRNTSTINSMQGLFNSYCGDTEPWTYTKATEVEFDGLNVLFVPWINNENRDATMQKIQDTSATVLMGHLEIFGFAMHRGAPNLFGDAAATFDKFDMVMTGHYHHKSDNGTIFYLGAPYEMIWSDFQDVRGFHIFDTDTRELEHIRNPNRMYHKIFYNDKDKAFEDVVGRMDYTQYKNTCIKLVVQEKTNPYWFDMVLDKIYKNDPFNLTIVEDYSEDLLTASTDLSIDQAKDTMTILATYIESLEDNTRKDDLKAFIKDLYVSAVQAEND